VYLYDVESTGDREQQPLPCETVSVNLYLYEFVYYHVSKCMMCVVDNLDVRHRAAQKAQIIFGGRVDCYREFHKD